MWRPTMYTPEQMNARYYIWAAGHFPEQLQQELLLASNDRLAQRTPPIPAWLGSNPPLMTVMVPNGEILAYGPLGLNLIKSNQTMGPVMYSEPEGELWYRYTKDGYLLGTYKLGPNGRSFGDRGWRDIYADWESLEAKMEEMGLSTGRHFLSSGYRAYVEREDNVPNDPFGYRVKSIIAAYDFQGNPVDPDSPMPQGELGAQELDQTYLRQIYDAQVQLGFTDPNGRSPWEGHPSGPLVADPAPRPPNKVALRSIWKEKEVGTKRSIGTDWILINPLGDAANPYREQYGPWDAWILEHAHKQNPREYQFYSEQFLKESEERRKKEQETGKPQPNSYRREPYVQPPDDHWQSFHMRVDDQGNMLPLLSKLSGQTERRDLRQPFDGHRQTEYFTFSAGGILPEEIRSQLVAKLDSEYPYLIPPALPDWLISQPVYGVIFMPSGDVVTRGALGSNKNEPDRVVTNPDGSVSLQRPKSQSGWYRYSASGELLGVTTDDRAGWQQLFNPQLASLGMSGQSQGYQADYEGPYLIWRKPREQGGQAVSAWNYDGTPVSLDQPLYAPVGEFKYWRWEELIKARQGIVNFFPF